MTEIQNVRTVLAAYPNCNLTWTSKQDGRDTMYEGRDSKAKLVSTVFDKNSDGRVDYRCGRWQDEEVHTLYDYKNGKISSLQERRYGEKGLHYKALYDSNADGHFNIIVTEERNENVVEHSIISDIDDDGKVDQSSIISDFDDDGEVDQIFTGKYDKNGYLVKVDKDLNGDGKIDDISTYEYDKKGCLTKFVSDKNGDGKVDKVLVFEYDENKQPVKIFEDSDGDGEVNKEYSLYDQSLISLDEQTSMKVLAEGNAMLGRLLRGI